MTTDTTPLQERIEHALWGFTQVYDAKDGRGTEIGVHAPVHEVLDAILPIVAGEVRKAKADARDEGYAACYARRLQSDRWPYPDEDEQAEKEYAEACGRSAATRAPNPYREKED